MKTTIEAQEQIRFSEWLKCNYPDVLFTISIAGVNLPMKTAKRMKDMGYRRGTPDILIFEPRENWHGMAIEMKAPKTVFGEKGRLSPEQQNFLQRLIDRNYRAVYCHGADEAIRVFEEYVKT